MNTQTMDEITPEIVAEHGLSPEEYDKVLEILGRTPNITELGIFSVMWSEHCSYKSSKKWLKTLPTEAPWVICGPGENAGVVDIGDGQAAIFKMESHNHPSYIEPYQGAATGVGGIMRDVFTMGARPVANLNALRFGAPEHPKTRHLLSGVVAGIGGYGNCMGVPTVGGECEFDPSYDGNILVNAMTVGLADSDKIFYSAAAGIGNPVVYVGSKTGRDGIHGATMASTEFSEDTEEKRPTVQVGDPFTEKLLLEACLELMKTDAIVAIQDMGAAGLTSSSFEMASKGGVGVELDLDSVPQREEGMSAYEMMLSESQERMLMVLKPGREEMARAVFEKWELDFAVIGVLTDTGRMVLSHKGARVADLPIDPLAEASPEYDRPWTPTPARARLSPADVPAPADPVAALKTMIGSANLGSRRWIWEQYDHMVMADTIARPGGDAAVVRVHGTTKGLAMSSDCTPRYCVADPVEGGKQAVAESWRNITATGARPLAITDNMNFGNPQRPEIMGQFVGCIDGIAEACRALDYPVVSGNVSLYNETNGAGILPTPTIGGLGVLDDIAKRMSIAFPEEGQTLLLVGITTGHLGCGRYLDICLGRRDGTPPPVDLAQERANGDFVRDLIHDGCLTACHDVSDGGLAIALAEMAIAGDIGAQITPPAGAPALHAWMFGEDQARYILCTRAPGIVMARAADRDIPIRPIGNTGGTQLTFGDRHAISVAELRRAHENWMPDFMTRR
ncbi:phosphoribosylformylglycinamidine synthase subunit PurL [Varunaivibrio sulfuroxidans]|uniref:Phosphoribosylformylglycinamidine synthase subunit PurL n=1 Tax=Varunaivibrio sulfuroxidans TaxID=1773489 RepID=A0A4R3JGL9_9PROT|nr:phosphoribosylformylglycinamidine synthase subunit PurL [Varunaivibrio sulfuroxidans]TCS65072.1 phosphoribosylformylglycinamidine synthase subunit II [Varunaivibrio sulfuroxidans]WES29641.1 phosphoribosylformylglycinamidine synthase subunit PurL [Varunaivibrio sulfuroxidans]